MKIKIFAFAVIFLLIGTWLSDEVSAQSPTFRKSYDVTLFDIAGGMIESSTGDYLFAGGGIQAILTNLNDTGVVQWSRNYNSGFVAQFNDIKEVSTGGYILCGSSSSNGAILTRVDVSGNLIWSMRYQYPNGGGKTSSEYAYAVIETTDGGFLVGGGVEYFWDGVSGSTVDTTSAMAFKVNSSGALQWNRVWTLTNPTKIGHHYINDVAESADGYFFVGESDDETQPYDSEGDLPSDALLIKTDFSGVTQYIRRWGHGGSSSQGINSAITLTTGANAGKILMGGYDDVHAFLITVDGTGGTPTLGSFNRRINGSAFGSTYILTDIMENPDGNYSFMGTRLQFLSVALNTMLVKINSSSNAIIFGKSYAPIGLSSLLPRGGIASDGGYFTSQLDQQFTGFNFNVIRTDANGDIGSSLSGCVPTNFTPGTQAYAPALSTPASAEYTSMTASATVPAITDVSVTQTLHCLACIPPAAATDISANPNPICVGQSTTINATGPATGVTYNVYTSASGGSSLGSTPLVVSPASTTTYYIETVSNADGSCVSTTRPSITVTVNSLPTPTATNNGPVCEGTSLDLTGGPGSMSSYSWSGPNGFSSSTQSPNVSATASPAMAGTYTLTVNDGTCTNSTTTVVSVNAIPTATASNNGPVCIGSSLDLTGGSGGMSSYNWSGPDGFSNATQSPNVSGSVTPAMAGTYTLTISDGTCTSTASTTVTVNSLPNPNLGADVGTCVGQGIAITASGGGTYSWSPTSDLSCSNCANPTASPAATTTYTVTVTDGNGCSASEDIVVNIYTAPPADAGTDADVCIGSSVSLNATGAGVGGSYSWSPGTGLSATNIANPDANPTTSTTYTVTVTDAAGCSETDDVVVTVNQLPTATAASNGPVCIGSSLDLTGGDNGMSSYDWAGPDGFVSSSQSPNVSSNVTPAMAGTYTITVSDGLCSNTASVVVTVNSLPNPNLGSDVGTCMGYGVNITASGGGTYAWSPTTDLSCSNCASPIATPSDTTTYTVTVTDANGCSNTEDIVVLVYNAPTANAGTDDAICLGESTNLSATGGATYSWSPGTGLSATNIANPIANPDVTTTYTVTVSDGSGCSATDEVTITVNPLPNANAGSNVTICPGDSTQLSASGGTNYLWSPSATLSDANIFNPWATPVSTTAYDVTVTDVNGCSSTDNVTVTVSIPTADAGSDATICLNSSTQLSASGGSSYAWSPSTGLSSSTVSNPTANPSSTTSYVVTVTNASGCTATDAVTVNVNPLPTANAGVDATICNGASTTLSATGGSTYSWSPGTGLSATNISNPVATPAITTVYTVTVTDGNGCTDSDDVTVDVNAAPVANAGTDQGICLGETAMLTATGGGSYDWNTGDTTATVSYTPSVTTTYVVTVSYANGCSASDEVVVTIYSIPIVTLSSDPSDYAYTGQIVTFTALPDGYSTYDFFVDGVMVQTGTSNVYQTNSLTDGQVVSVMVYENSCNSELDTIAYDIKPIPNAFTPYDINGKNDIFVKGLDITIFNRWNQILYEGSEGWDGKFNGKLVSPGTYYYIVKITDLTNTVNEIHGSVTVVDNQ